MFNSTPNLYPPAARSTILCRHNWPYLRTLPSVPQDEIVPRWEPLMQGVTPTMAPVFSTQKPSKMPQGRLINFHSQASSFCFLAGKLAAGNGHRNSRWPLSDTEMASVAGARHCSALLLLFWPHIRALEPKHRTGASLAHWGSCWLKTFLGIFGYWERSVSHWFIIIFLKTLRFKTHPGDSACQDIIRRKWQR